MQPGESPATFGDALRRLTDQATYLYVDGQRYWYSLQPSVTRLAHDRAAQVREDDIDEEIRARLASATRGPARGDFGTVHPAPRSPAEVPDEPEVRLVVLGPEHPHSGKTDDSPARRAASEILEKRSAGDRIHRNMLVFLAPDKTRLEELRQAARDLRSWRSIDEEKDALDLGSFQRKQVESKCDQLDDVVNQRIGETLTWVLVPSQAAGDPTITWDETRVSGQEPIAVRAAKKLKTEEALITEYSGARLRMDLDRVPLWRGDHVTVKQLWSDYSQYLYLPRLRDQTVLLDAIRQGVALLTWNPDTFAYASAYDDAASRYAGLVGGQHATVVLDTASVLVKPDVAALQREPEPDPGPGPGPGPQPRPGPGPGPEPAPEPEPTPPRRFYGRVSLQPVRMLRDLGDIADAIVAQLGRADAEVTVTVEIEASAEAGFGDDVRRTVSENARTLKFETHEFED